MRRITSLYSKATATSKGSDVADGLGRDLRVDPGVEGRVEAR